MARVKDTSLAKKAYNHFGIDYIRTYPDDLSKFQSLVDEFLLCTPAGGRILDIGCGNGAYVDYFLKQGFDAIGIDISETMLEAARRIVPAERLLLMDMQYLEAFSPSTFDAVSSVTSMLYVSKEHLPGILLAVKRLLKPGGSFLLIMLEGKGEGLENERYFDKEAVTYVAYYYPKELKQLLESCGFSIQKVSLTKLVVLSRREITLIANT